MQSCSYRILHIESCFCSKTALREIERDLHTIDELHHEGLLFHPGNAYQVGQ